MDGFAENVINYILSKNKILKLHSILKAKNINLNESRFIPEMYHPVRGITAGIRRCDSSFRLILI